MFTVRAPRSGVVRIEWASGRNPDRFLKGAPHLFGLTVLPAEAFKACLEHRNVLELLERHTLDAAGAFHVGQFDAARHIRAADGALGLGALGDRRDLVEE